MPGPRFVDADQASKVKDSTLLNYRKAALALTVWMRDTGFDPQTASEWDDILVEYKHAHAGALNRAKFIVTISAVEFVLPQTRKQLTWSHAVVAGWSATAIIRHTVPMTWPAAQLVGVQMVGFGLPRLACGILLQTATGLRPGEMLQLRPDDLAFPEASGVSLADRPLAIALGAKSGTKIRRQQVVLLDHHHHQLVAVLRLICVLTPTGCQLFPYALAYYRDWLKRVEKRLGLSLGWGPHSPRSGFATDLKTTGVPFTEIRERGRWQSDTSLRTYLDVVGAASVTVALRSAGLASSLAWAAAHWPQYFNHRNLAPPYC